MARGQTNPASMQCVRVMLTRRYVPEPNMSWQGSTGFGKTPKQAAILAYSYHLVMFADHGLGQVTVTSARVNQSTLFLCYFYQGVVVVAVTFSQVQFFGGGVGGVRGGGGRVVAFFLYHACILSLLYLFIASIMLSLYLLLNVSVV